MMSVEVHATQQYRMGRTVTKKKEQNTLGLELGEGKREGKTLATNSSVFVVPIPRHTIYYHSAAASYHFGRKYKDRPVINIDTKRSLHLRPDHYICAQKTRATITEV